MCSSRMALYCRLSPFLHWPYQASTCLSAHSHKPWNVPICNIWFWIHLSKKVLKILKESKTKTENAENTEQVSINRKVWLKRSHWIIVAVSWTRNGFPNSIKSEKMQIISGDFWNFIQSKIQINLFILYLLLNSASVEQVNSK